MSVVTIEPPLWIIDIGNGCEAFSSTLYIPAKSELTTTMQSLTRSQFFLNYNFQYAKMSSFVVFHEITFAQLTPEELANLQSKVQTLEHMDMKLFNEKLKMIDENYPLTLPPGYPRRSSYFWHFYTNWNNTHSLALFEAQKRHEHFVKTWSYFSQKNTEWPQDHWVSGTVCWWTGHKSYSIRSTSMAIIYN